jgi:hypothetical protein
MAEGTNFGIKDDDCNCKGLGSCKWNGDMS